MDIPLIKPDLPSFEEVAEPFKEVLSNGKITNFGKYVALFEKEAGAYLGAHAVTVASGTMGLIFALQSLGLEPKGKVLLPSFTFMATAQAVLYAGGVPVFAEVGEDLTLSVSDLEYLLERHKDAACILPVHMYGLPCQVEKIQEVADRVAQRMSKPVPVVYDAAHAFGSAINGKKVGSFGDAEAFSLSVTKLLVSVEGGMVVSKNADVAHRIRKMRNYGIEDNYDAHWQGLNGKMSEFHAIIGLHNLRRLDALLEERNRKARYYAAHIRGRTRFQTPALPDGITQTFKDFTILVPDESAGKRDAVMVFLREHGIETRAYFFPPVHQQRFFRAFADRALPHTERISRRVITLPFYTTMSEAEIDYVVSVLIDAERRLL